MSDKQPNDGKSKRKRQTPVTSMTTVAKVGWLTVTAYATLQIVQTANYLRFGPNGVRRFGPGTPTSAKPHPHAISTKLTLKQIGGKVLLDYSDLILHNPNSFDLDGMNIWEGVHSNAHLSVTWVWDFYRLLSGVRLALDLSKASSGADWKAIHDSLNALHAGDKVILEASSLSGDILQIYPFEGLTVEDTPQ